MFCEKAMELVRELHRAPEGQLPAFNVRSGGRAGACRGLGRGLMSWGRGLCLLLLTGDFFSSVSCWLNLTSLLDSEIGNKKFETGPNCSKKKKTHTYVTY